MKLKTILIMAFLGLSISLIGLGQFSTSHLKFFATNLSPTDKYPLTCEGPFELHGFSGVLVPKGAQNNLIYQAKNNFDINGSWSCYSNLGGKTYKVNICEYSREIYVTITNVQEGNTGTYQLQIQGGC